jgi:hypothetical protein
MFAGGGRIDCNLATPTGVGTSVLVMAGLEGAQRRADHTCLGPELGASDA